VVTDFSNVTMTVLGVLFALLMLWVAMRYALLFARSARGGWPKSQYIAIADPDPPEPVEPTVGLSVLTTLALVWVALHFAGTAVWAGTGLWAPRIFSNWLIAIYYLCASVTTGIGAVMLLRRQRYGRRAISMGQFLFAIVTYLALAIVVLQLQNPDVERAAKPPLVRLAIVLGGHVLIDTALGWAAHQVGRPVDQQPVGQAS